MDSTRCWKSGCAPCCRSAPPRASRSSPIWAQPIRRPPPARPPKSGTVAGHLLECAGQITGGYFADPPYKDVPDLARLGFPIGEIGEDGSLVITKVEGSGGAVTAQTCKEQLLYEVHDPRRYIQPDVTADFSKVTVEEIGKDRVRVTGGRGSKRPATLKVSVGYADSFIGEGQISYAGPGALGRGRLALEI